MDSYKLKKYIMIIIIVIINGILIGMASISVMQSIKKQLKAENSQAEISEVTQEDNAENVTSTETNLEDNMNLDFNSVIQYIKDGRLGIFLAGLKILIGMNLMIISILIFLRLKR